MVPIGNLKTFMEVNEAYITYVGDIINDSRDISR